jgi:starch synthase (maltosyl-transferring)
LAKGDGKRRVIIEGVSPEIDCGRFPIKRTLGEAVCVEADIFTDGHDAVRSILRFKKEGEKTWREVPMLPLVNDRWKAEFTVEALGRYRYTLRAHVDPFLTWHRDLAKRLEAKQDVSLELLVGANLIEASAARAGKDADRLRKAAEVLRNDGPLDEKIRFARDPALPRLVGQYPDPATVTTYAKELEVFVDRERARFSAWYEMFPRSLAEHPDAHGTFADVEKTLPYVAAMGFDVLYLPPIHPIGNTKRKGPNNALSAGPDDPGSPWAIGGPEGGHKAIHPQLGSLADFHKLVAAAKKHGMELALDIAFQCSPDHPYVREHPDWFRSRPDGTIQYAENPPKKYEDIYPFDFESDDWAGLWEELRGIFRYWIDQGVRIFRVDNPHTKALPFWEWALTTLKNEFPDTIFLAEAFTRPRPLYHLAKLGFSQSYNYFPWRNTKWELEEYFTELTQTEVREYFRANLWPNTPDILTEYLQHGGRPAHIIRLVLAATLGASYGIYGPAFELFESRPRKPGSEEYLDSEKYELRQWKRDRPDSLKDLIARVNKARRENPALQYDQALRFHKIGNDDMLCYSKATPDKQNVVLMVVNLSPHHKQAGWVDLSLAELGLDEGQAFQVHDLLSDARYIWHGARNFVELDPHVLPVHLFRIRRRVQHEEDFEYYL